MKIKTIEYLVPILCLAFSCTGKETEPEASNIAENETSIAFNFTKSPHSVDLVRNAEVYLFDGDGPAAHQFQKKVPSLTRGANSVSCQVDAGKYDVALITAESSLEGRLISPVRGSLRKNLKMWETKPAGGVLPPVPMLRTAVTQGVNVAPNTSTTANAAPLGRNVALVKVIITSAGGLNTAGTHTFELLDVPTTLNWDGGLYPDKDNPAVSSVPMKGNFTVTSNSATGLQKSDTLKFVIPAHKGTDYLSSNPTDVTTKHLRFNVNLEQVGGGHFIRNGVSIQNVHRANGILLVRLEVKGELTVNSEILPWKDEQLSADLAGTTLYVDKASVNMASSDMVHINTNASSFSVTKEPGNTWLTVVTNVAEKKIELRADVNSFDYTAGSRSTYITVKAGNINKKIPVIQRPEKSGTIKIYQPPTSGSDQSFHSDRLVFCPATHTSRKAKIECTGGGWKLWGIDYVNDSDPGHPVWVVGAEGALRNVSNFDKARASAMSGNAGTSEVTFTRADAGNINSAEKGMKAYGRERVIVQNTTTLELATLYLDNCYIYVDNGQIDANSPTGENVWATTNSQDLVVFGGERNIDNLRVTNATASDGSVWIKDLNWNRHNALPDGNLDGGILSLTTHRHNEPGTPQDDIDEPRTGYIKFRHKECPDYEVTVKVYQDIIITIPPFTYFVVKFTWDGADVDIAVEFRNNRLDKTGDNTTYDKRPVGWSFSSNVSYKGQTLLKWGGDATGGEGETVFFNAPLFEGDQDSPRKIDLDIYSTWYRYGNARWMRFTMYAYLGGTMVQNGTNFNNQGGSLLYEDTRKITVTTYRGRDTYNTGGYTKVATLTYDRVKHSAKINMHAPVISSVIERNLPPLPEIPEDSGEKKPE